MADSFFGFDTTLLVSTINSNNFVKNIYYSHVINGRYITGSACLIFFNKQARRGRNVSFFLFNHYSTFIIMSINLINRFYDFNLLCWNVAFYHRPFLRGMNLEKKLAWFRFVNDQKDISLNLTSVLFVQKVINIKYSKDNNFRFYF